MTDLPPHMPRRGAISLTQGLAVALFLAVYGAALLLTLAPAEWLGARSVGGAVPTTLTAQDTP